MRGRLQHPVAAAHDCQEGDCLLAPALFAPVRVGKDATEMAAIDANMAATGAQQVTCAPCVELKTNKSGATNEGLNRHDYDWCPDPRSILCLQGVYMCFLVGSFLGLKSAPAPESV